MIILTAQSDGLITATFDLQEQEHAEIKRLFGTDTIPTPYFVDARAPLTDDRKRDIANTIRKLNPNSLVQWDHTSR